MDRANRKLLITFSGINPDTGEHHPDGFLPPNANPPAGEGYLTFTIKPKADTASGTVIRNKAKIVFDPHLGVNPPMETDEHVLTVDKQAPTVRVADLPSEHPVPSFPVQWDGSDDALGIRKVEIWFSENGGPLTLFETLAPGETRQVQGRTTFKGKFGHEYRFYAIAEDKVGNRSALPDQPQATTRTGTPPTIGAGLRMLTLPVISEIADAKQVFGFAANKWVWYAPTQGSYVRYPNPAAATLQVGKGFWGWFAQDVQPNVRGALPDDTQPLAIALRRGWNLIGNPWLGNVDWNPSQIKARQNGVEKSLAEAQQAGWVEDYALGWQPDANDPSTGRYVLVYDRNLLPGA